MSQITDVLVSIDTKTIVDRYGKNSSMANPPSSTSSTSS